MMSRTALINLCFWLTLIAVAGAFTLRTLNAPPGIPGRDSLVVLSPLFFGMAAKKASHLGKAAVLVAFIGLAFGALAMYGALSAPEAPRAATPAPR